MITAVIPCRTGSTRCPNKNVRPFGTTKDYSLLKRKIRQLKKVEEIVEIIVSSNCGRAREIAENEGVRFHNRAAEFCTSDCPINLVYVECMKPVETDDVMWVLCMAPFANESLLRKAVHAYVNRNVKIHDSVVTVHNMCEFAWFHNKPLNYDSNRQPRSQDLKPLQIFTWGCVIAPTAQVRALQNVSGVGPIFVCTDAIEAIDIDDPHEFILSELLDEYAIENERCAHHVMSRRQDRVLLLDCTIRDGGYLNNWSFSLEEVLSCYKAVSRAGYDYFEIGFRASKSLEPGHGKWYYTNDEDLQSVVDAVPDGCPIAVMCKMGTFSISDVSPYNPAIRLVRVQHGRVIRADIPSQQGRPGIHVADLNETRVMCDAVHALGYETCLNFSNGELMTEADLDIISQIFHDAHYLKAIYLADTFGALRPRGHCRQQQMLFQALAKYGSTLPVGCHAHNNTEEALSSTLASIQNGCRIIDTCVNGQGRGGGNCKTELLLLHLGRMAQCETLAVHLKKYSDVSSFYYAWAANMGIHPDYICWMLKKKWNATRDVQFLMYLGDAGVDKKSVFSPDCEWE